MFSWTFCFCWYLAMHQGYIWAFLKRWCLLGLAAKNVIHFGPPPDVDVQPVSHKE